MKDALREMKDALHYIFRHWGPEQYALKDASKKVKWFS